MIKELDIKNFYNQNEFNIGVTVIAPYEISSLTGDVKYHDQLINEIIKNMIDCESNISFLNYNECKYHEKWINSIIKNGKKNFVTIRYIKYPDLEYVTIYIPGFITSYQVKELKKLSKMFKELNLDIYLDFLDYNPITKEDTENDYFKFNVTNNYKIDATIYYLHINERIKEYQLPEFEKKKVL